MIDDHHAGNMCTRQHHGGGEILAESLPGGGQGNHGRDLVSRCSRAVSGLRSGNSRMMVL